MQLQSDMELMYIVGRANCELYTALVPYRAAFFSIVYAMHIEVLY